MDTAPTDVPSVAEVGQNLSQPAPLVDAQVLNVISPECFLHHDPEVESVAGTETEGSIRTQPQQPLEARLQIHINNSSSLEGMPLEGGSTVRSDSKAPSPQYSLFGCGNIRGASSPTRACPPPPLPSTPEADKVPPETTTMPTGSSDKKGDQGVPESLTRGLEQSAETRTEEQTQQTPLPLLVTEHEKVRDVHALGGPGAPQAPGAKFGSFKSENLMGPHDPSTTLDQHNTNVCNPHSGQGQVAEPAALAKEERLVWPVHGLAFRSRPEDTEPDEQVILETRERVRVHQPLLHARVPSIQDDGPASTPATPISLPEGLSEPHLSLDQCQAPMSGSDGTSGVDTDSVTETGRQQVTESMAGETAAGTAPPTPMVQKAPRASRSITETGITDDVASPTVASTVPVTPSNPIQPSGCMHPDTASDTNTYRLSMTPMTPNNAAEVSPTADPTEDRASKLSPSPAPPSAVHKQLRNSESVGTVLTADDASSLTPAQGLATPSSPFMGIPHSMGDEDSLGCRPFSETSSEYIESLPLTTESSSVKSQITQVQISQQNLSRHGPRDNVTMNVPPISVAQSSSTTFLGAVENVESLVRHFIASSEVSARGLPTHNSELTSSFTRKYPSPGFDKGPWQTDIDKGIQRATVLSVDDVSVETTQPNRVVLSHDNGLEGDEAKVNDMRFEISVPAMEVESIGVTSPYQEKSKSLDVPIEVNTRDVVERQDDHPTHTHLPIEIRSRLESAGSQNRLNLIRDGSSVVDAIEDDVAKVEAGKGEPIILLGDSCREPYESGLYNDVETAQDMAGLHDMGATTHPSAPPRMEYVTCDTPAGLSAQEGGPPSPIQHGSAFVVAGSTYQETHSDVAGQRSSILRIPYPPPSPTSVDYASSLTSPLHIPSPSLPKECDPLQHGSTTSAGVKWLETKSQLHVSRGADEIGTDAISQPECIDTNSSVAPSTPRSDLGISATVSDIGDDTRSEISNASKDVAPPASPRDTSSEYFRLDIPREVWKLEKPVTPLATGLLFGITPGRAMDLGAQGSIDPGGMPSENGIPVEEYVALQEDIRTLVAPIGDDRKENIVSVFNDVQSDDVAVSQMESLADENSKNLVLITQSAVVSMHRSESLGTAMELVAEPRVDARHQLSAGIGPEDNDTTPKPASTSLSELPEESKASDNTDDCASVISSQESSAYATATQYEDDGLEPSQIPNIDVPSGLIETPVSDISLQSQSFQTPSTIEVVPFPSTSSPKPCAALQPPIRFRFESTASRYPQLPGGWREARRDLGLTFELVEGEILNPTPEKSSKRGRCIIM